MRLERQHTGTHVSAIKKIPNPTTDQGQALISLYGIGICPKNVRGICPMAFMV